MDTNRISLSAIGAAPTTEPIYVQIGEATVEVRPSISYGEILEMMQWCIDMIVGEKPFVSAALSRIVKDVAIISHYTNLDCCLATGKYSGMAEIYAEYDIIKNQCVMENILPKIDAGQISFFENTLDKTIESIITYRNSAVGIVDVLAANAQQDTDKMAEAMAFLDNEESAEKVGRLLNIAKQIQAPVSATSN